MKFKIEQHTRNTVSVWRDETTISAAVYCGEEEACKTAAEAREAAELLKAFFEAKEAGKVARLVVDEKQCLGERCVLDGECFNRDKGLCWFDPANEWPPTAEPQRHKNTVIDQMNENAEAIANRIWGNRAHDMTLEQYEVFTIAHNAALIFTHNAHDIDERRAVQSAAKILLHAKQSL